MKRYNITVGAPTTAGGKVMSGWEYGSINDQLVAREGDAVACPACRSIGVIACVGPHLVETWGDKNAALEGDLCLCKCDPPPKLIANQTIKWQGFDTHPQSIVEQRARPSTPSPQAANMSAPAAMNRSADACVFAKSCVSVPAGSTAAGKTPERASNFGSTALMASTGTAGTLGRVAGTVGSDLGAWAVRGLTGAAAGASTAFNVVLLAFWPRDISDSTLYTAEQLAGMHSASTRVRFQFRQDETGELRVYGIHTKPESGADRVPVAQARWNADKSAMVAVLDGISITWTPNNGPVVNVPSPYPSTQERLDNLFVHPIAVGQDSAISHYPGREVEDVTWQDTIISFPADSGVPPLYLVFAKPMVTPLEVGRAADLMSRSRRDGLDIDHIPAQKVLEATLLQLDAKMPRQQILDYLKNAPSIAIPTRIHQKHSETYGGRSTRAKQAEDVADLRAAVNSNVDAIKRGLLEDGYHEAEIEAARERLHQLSQQQGWY